MDRDELIDTPVLRYLVTTGKAGTLIARGVPGGFVLVVRDGLDERRLVAQRGHLRKFKRLEAVAAYLDELGAHSFEVDLNGWGDGAFDM